MLRHDGERGKIMYGFEYPADLNVGRVCLELSLKPFKSLGQKEIEKVCGELFDQWRELLLKASGCSVLLWTADGSEILDYSGNLTDEIEWARYLGLANPPQVPHSWDPQRKGLHSAPRYYMDNPARITYADLQRIITTLKQIGKQVTGLNIMVGETFDPGPEFARSDFKYSRHTEIVKGAMEGENGAKSWVHCTSILKGDNRRYAAYPAGIPDGLPIGTFLGRQFQALARDVGFDYLWFSNGFGFSRDSWSWTGECFDGQTFFAGAGQRVKKQIIEFWQNFTEACPGMRIETRGSNLSTGMDIAAHGSPLAEIYQYIPVAPPNSPWAALDAQFGLELTGYMSHIAEVPEDGFLYRFYTHDPWWINSPWFDRYNRQPHDIYLPLSLARLDHNLKVMQPYGISFLTADDSFGNLPRRCPVEVIPHLLDAWSHYPDAPGPVTWVYPFAQNHQIGYDSQRASEVLFGDWLIKSAIDSGMPLNSVISDRNFIKAAERLAGRSVLVMPVPDQGSAVENAVFKVLAAGGDVLLYGPAGHASAEMRALAGITLGEPLEGEFKVAGRLSEDEITTGTLADTLQHIALLSGGGLEACAGDGAEVRIMASNPAGAKRVYYTFNNHAKSGRLAWVRGSFPCEHQVSLRLPDSHKASDHVVPGTLMRLALEDFNIVVRFSRRHVNDKSPMVLYSNSGNSMYVTGYAPDTTCKMMLSLPDGAPIMLGSDCVVQNNRAEYALVRSWHTECRVFVKQQEESKISCIVKPSVYPGIDRRFYLTGLVNADVIFRKTPGTQVKLVNIPYVDRHGDADKFLDTNVAYAELAGDRILCSQITGALMIAWGTGETYPLVE